LELTPWARNVLAQTDSQDCSNCRISSVILVIASGSAEDLFYHVKDGLLPPVFSKVHPRFKTPYIKYNRDRFVAMIIAGILPISILGELVSIGTLLAFIIVCISVLVLRKARPEIHRPFKTPESLLSRYWEPEFVFCRWRLCS